MAPPTRQMVLLSRVEEVVTAHGRAYPLACNEYPGLIHPQGHQNLRAFSPDPFPRWAYQANGWTVAKSLVLLADQNTVCLSYTLLGGNEAIDFELRPLFALRGIHELGYQWNGRLMVETDGVLEPTANTTRANLAASQGRAASREQAASRERAGEGARRDRAGAGPVGGTNHRIPATSRTPEVFFTHDGTFQASPDWYLNTIYRREQERGYAGLEDLWSPGVARWALHPGQTVHFICSADPIDLPRVLADVDLQTARLAPPVVAGAAPDAAPDPALEALVKAAEAFIVRVPTKGVVPAAAAASGSSSAPMPERPADIYVLSGLPWGVPTGRDALIAFTGLFLVPGKLDDARQLLAFLATQAHDGLLPSEWPTDGSGPRYASADASLWFVHAIHQYLRYGGDAAFVRRQLFEVIDSILRQYQRGTGLGIVADSEGLLRAGAGTAPASWMDAVVGDWVITPRHGRAVELNALWYNALRVAADLARQFGFPARGDELLALAHNVKAAFNRRFWNAAACCCYDVVGDAGVEAAIRPNQVLAVSLPFPVLDAERHAEVLEAVRQHLLTPRGLRTLSPADGAYQGHYGGGVVSRDRAYHQGSAYPWLLGPFVSAYARLHGHGAEARAEARRMLEGCLECLSREGLGQIGELCDGDAPHAGGGLPASARSVGEVLRAYAEDVLDLAPPRDPFAGGGSVGDVSAFHPGQHLTPKT